MVPIINLPYGDKKNAGGLTETLIEIERHPFG